MLSENNPLPCFVGSATIQSVVSHTLGIFKAKFLYFVKNITNMEELFEVSFTKQADGGKPFSRYGEYFLIQ